MIKTFLKQSSIKLQIPHKQYKEYASYKVQRTFEIRSSLIFVESNNTLNGILF